MPTRLAKGGHGLVWLVELPATAARLGSAGNCNLQRRIPDGRDNEPTNRGPNLAPLGRNYSQRPLRGAMCLLLYPFTENVGRRDLRLIPAKVSSSSAEPGVSMCRFHFNALGTSRFRTTGTQRLSGSTPFLPSGVLCSLVFL